MRICSACLLGFNCAYHGRSKQNDKVIELSKKEILIPVCPEQMGCMPTPRPDSEIRGGDGSDVLEGNAKIIEPDGNDVTEYYVKGAQEVLKLAKLLDIDEAILKQSSPSCACGQIHDRTFSGKVIKGDGVTTALLKKNGIKVISEEDL